MLRRSRQPTFWGKICHSKFFSLPDIVALASLPCSLSFPCLQLLLFILVRAPARLENTLDFEEQRQEAGNFG
jgi:hypothetical protein